MITKEILNSYEKHSIFATGLLPDDWDNLSEDEKETRLNGAIGILSSKEV